MSLFEIRSRQEWEANKKEKELKADKDSLMEGTRFFFSKYVKKFLESTEISLSGSLRDYIDALVRNLRNNGIVLTIPIIVSSSDETNSFSREKKDILVIVANNEKPPSKKKDGKILEEFREMINMDEVKDINYFQEIGTFEVDGKEYTPVLMNLDLESYDRLQDRVIFPEEYSISVENPS